MATIALYESKINIMPSLLKDVNSSVGDLKSEFTSLIAKSLKISKNICDLDDVIDSMWSSTVTQEQKESSLRNISEKVEEFADEVEKIDSNVADSINESKDDFYDKYYYLKPEGEKNGWEKFCDGVEAVGEWCKEHWKLIVTVVLVIAAVIIIVATAGTALGPFSLLLLGAAKGILFGATVGGLIGGTISAIAGKGFFEGFEDGAFAGAISGAITGGLTSWLEPAVGAGLKIGQTMLLGAGSEFVASLFGDLGDIAIKGDKISAGEVAFNAAFSFVLGGIFSAGGHWLGNNCKIRIPKINKGNGSWLHVWKTQVAGSLGRGWKVSLKTIMKGMGAGFVEDLWGYILEIPKSIINENIEYENLIPQN